VAHHRDPEVHDLDLLALGLLREEDVLGLEVPVDDAVLVRGAQARGGLGRDARDPPHWQALPLLAEQVPEIVARQELHDDVDRAVLGRVQVEDLHDVVVADGRGRAGLALEALDLLGLDRGLGKQDLDGHLLLELDVLGLVDGAHPPPAQHRLDPVFPADHLSHGLLRVREAQADARHGADEGALGVDLSTRGAAVLLASH